ncbi:hypothetical protein BHE74_00009284 [Ensete ventricosum]|nr:hypothetical protein BHE74_00009284 [Ensete ventricosum]
MRAMMDSIISIKAWIYCVKLRNASSEIMGCVAPPLGGESPGSLNSLQYLLEVWDEAFPSWEGGKEACLPRLRIGCITRVSSPRCFSGLVGCWHSCDIGPSSSSKNINVLYVDVEVVTQLSRIRARKTASMFNGSQHHHTQVLMRVDTSGG